MNRRRAIVLGAVGFPLAMRAALAKGYSNAALLLGRVGLDKSTIPFDGEFSITCSLEARRHFCRVYTPLSWGKERGFKLSVEGADGKSTDPAFPQQTDLPTADLFKSMSHYRELDVGEQVSFRTKLKTKDIFKAPGSYTLRMTYLPEPPKASAAVGQAIVADNGPVVAGVIKVKVV